MTSSRCDGFALSTRVALGTVALVFANCATGLNSQPDSPALDISAIEKIEVKTSGASIACTPIDQQISGQVLYRTHAGDRLPVSDITLWVISGSSRGQRLDIQVDKQGQFVGKVRLWDHEFGSASDQGNAEFIPGRTAVALRAPGCDDFILDVGHDWKPLTVRMKCPGRP